eukprot:5504729-Pleurochrysis_carterae.AAC.1
MVVLRNLALGPSLAAVSILNTWGKHVFKKDDAERSLSTYAVGEFVWRACALALAKHSTCEKCVAGSGVPWIDPRS